MRQIRGEVRSALQKSLVRSIFNLGFFADWSLRSLFDRTVEKACPVASSSRIRVALPQEGALVHPEPALQRDAVAVYDVSGGEWWRPTSASWSD